MESAKALNIVKCLKGVLTTKYKMLCDEGKASLIHVDLDRESRSNLEKDLKFTGVESSRFQNLARLLFSPTSLSVLPLGFDIDYIRVAHGSVALPYVGFQVKPEYLKFVTMRTGSKLRVCVDKDFLEDALLYDINSGRDIRRVRKPIFSSIQGTSSIIAYAVGHRYGSGETEEIELPITTTSIVNSWVEDLESGVFPYSIDSADGFMSIFHMNTPGRDNEVFVKEGKGYYNVFSVDMNTRCLFLADNCSVGLIDYNRFVNSAEYDVLSSLTEMGGIFSELTGRLFCPLHREYLTGMGGRVFLRVEGCKGWRAF